MQQHRQPDDSPDEKAICNSPVFHAGMQTLKLLAATALVGMVLLAFAGLLHTLIHAPFVACQGARSVCCMKVKKSLRVMQPPSRL